MTPTEKFPGRIVSRDEWLEARTALLAEEKAMTRARDELAKKRRAMPWVRVEKPYVFQTPTGKAALADLFRGRSQLAVYHFMLTPGKDDICSGCAYLSDHTDAARQHFEHADLAFCAISRAPIEHIERVKKRMGWTFPWVSSAGTSFNYDFGVSFKPEDIAAGRAIYNYGTPIKSSEDMHGTSIFAKHDGDVYHTYSCYARGNELLAGAFIWLDLAPKGRNEDGIMSWVRLHDDYDQDEAAQEECCTTPAAQARA